MSITNVHGVGQLPFAAKALFGAPRCPSANGIGYVPGAGNIYIISGSNTGFIESAQDRTWAYEPVANSWTDLTATVSFPHPAGGFAYGVINNKVYLSGGRDANNDNINLPGNSIPQFQPTRQRPTSRVISQTSRVALSPQRAVCVRRWQSLPRGWKSRNQAPLCFKQGSLPH